MNYSNSSKSSFYLCYFFCRFHSFVDCFVPFATGENDPVLMNITPAAFTKMVFNKIKTEASPKFTLMWRPAFRARVGEKFSYCEQN